MTKEEFVERMIEADRIISEQLNKCAEERDENRKTWARIEKELTKLVGNKRTQAYDLYKFHSLKIYLQYLLLVVIMLLSLLYYQLQYYQILDIK